MSIAKVPFQTATSEQIDRARRMVVWGKEAVYVDAIRVQVSKLVATQDEVLVELLDELQAARERAGHVVAALGRIDVAHLGGHFVIVDGHHRATLAHRRGDKWISARVHRSVADVEERIRRRPICEFHRSQTCPCAESRDV